MIAQDTDSVLRIPRYPQDTAGVLRYNYRHVHDAAVSSGYRVPRMPSVSQDANSRLQMEREREREERPRSSVLFPLIAEIATQ